MLAVMLAGPGMDARAQWQRYADHGHFERPQRDIYFGGTFTFCRIQYSSHGSGWRGDRRWAIDYPEADVNFSQRLSEITTINVSRTETGEIHHAVVRLDDPELFKYPFIYMVEVGRLGFMDREIEGLRDYLLRGGFLMVDDFWGDAEWNNWEYEIGRVLPPNRFPIVDIPLDHPLFHIVFPIDEVPQIPAVNQYEYYRQTGITYEGQPTTDPSPHCRGIFDQDGRLMVVMMHNTDLGDGWEREGVHEGYFREFSAPKAYPMGINIIVYAMTH